MHLDSINVGYGDVLRGQVIGTMGNTGNSSGTHLHFTVRKDGKKVDPLLVFGWPYKFSNPNAFDIKLILSFMSAASLSSGADKHNRV